MKRAFLFLTAILTAAAFLSACKEESPKPAQAPAEQQSAPSGMQSEMGSKPGEVTGISGTVVETMNTAGYTYVLVDTGEEQIWAAGPETQVAEGDSVALGSGQEMHNFRSDSLDRTFDMILFVNGIMVGGESAAGAMTSGEMPQGHPDINKSQSVDVDFSGLTKADGGVTVAEIYTRKNELAGEEIQVRGKVVRFSPQIMGKNWIHLQDGTGEEGTADLTVTTAASAEVGDTVLVSGVLETEKDIAHGTVYEVILEDAEVVVE